MDIEKFGLVPWASPIASNGDRYGRLTILAVGKVEGTYRYFAVCSCDCGSEPRRYRIDKLRTGHTTSCGCAQHEATTKHGLWASPLYAVWARMMSRCTNPRDKRFSDYGGRGIAVCDAWRDVRGFVRDMQLAYWPGATIDRVDVNGDYKPENCRWVFKEEQARNKRSNITLTHEGKTQCLAEWARDTGLTYSTLWNRVVLHGWSAEKTLTTPALDADARCARARKARYGR